MTRHHLNTWPTYFRAAEKGVKTFEVRKNDRFFQRGDMVVLHELENDGPGLNARTGNSLEFYIGPILQGGQFGIEAGYCAFSLLPNDPAK